MMNPDVDQIHATASKLKKTIEACKWKKIEEATTYSNNEELIPVLKKMEKFSSDITQFQFQYVAVEHFRKFKNEFEQLEATTTVIIQESQNIGSISFTFNKDSFRNRSGQILEKFHDLCVRFLLFVEMVEYLEQSSVNIIANAAKEDIRNTKDEFDKYVNEIKDAAAQREGAIKYSDIFSKEALRFSDGALKWLIATIFLLLGTAGLAIWLLLCFEQITGNTEVIQFTITKVIITVILFYAINMCLKSYRAQKHNQILNEHRHNALQTFDLFQNSSNDVQTKSAVLMEVTRTIFGNQQTGYGSPTDGEGDNVPTKLIEIIKQAPK